MNTDWIMYISKNQEMVEIAILSMVFILLFLAVIQLGLLKRRVKGICKSIKKYLDVILTEEEGNDQAEAMETAAVSESMEVREIVRKDSREEAAFQQEKIQRKQQEDEKILMDVIQEVF